MLLLTWAVASLNHPAVTQIAVLASSTGDPITWLLNLGTAGVWLICYMTGLVHGKPEVDFLKAQLEDRDKQLDKRDQLIEALREQLTTRTIPALARVAGVVADYPQAQVVMPDQQATRIEELIARVERALPNEKP